MHIFKPADILLPKSGDMRSWSVVACDQFTSEPEYWEAVYNTVGDAPSTLHMMLPEAELGKKDPVAESARINAVMQQYYDGDIFECVQNSYIYLERHLTGGSVRRGLVGMLDLEAYDWHEGTHTPTRATEHTVEDRLPPRIKVRETALLEMPHIMVFFDDPGNTVFPAVKKGRVVYDFELMQNGGRISGWKVADNDAVDAALDALCTDAALKERYGSAENPIIFAMGDGNHSIAAAKSCWEIKKRMLAPSELDACPARYALVELVNIHDDAIVFEPIHKVIFNTDPADFIEQAEEFFAENRGNEREITVLSGNKRATLSVGGMTIGELIGACEDFCVAYTKRCGGNIDYIHGDAECIEMSGRENCCGILLPRMKKSELFSSVMRSGPFPKKSFSIGQGPDKRYYLECRKIR